MKVDFVKSHRSEAFPQTQSVTLTATYPRLYCPQCGSYEIGLRQFDNGDAIWGCKDCMADFALEFPRERRF